MIDRIKKVQHEFDFSGSVMVKGNSGAVTDAAFGKADKANSTVNKISTRFGIASGCKVFTAVAVCRLVEAGKLSLDDRVRDLLEYDFPYFDEDITIHHLLTHTSGIPDYFDETVMDDFEELWEKTPMYLLRSLKDFLPLFQNEKMMFPAGEKFHYNNAGYIMLGLVVEAVSGTEFTTFIEKDIFLEAGMSGSGYFELDRLPEDTAFGYIREDGGWKTNIYSLPVKGGADGGAFTTAPDMIRFWEALAGFKLLGEEMTGKLLTPHAYEDRKTGYGYGVWMSINEGEIDKCYVMGFDPGVNFVSAYYPETRVKAAVCSNHEDGAYEVLSAIEEALE